MTTTESEIEAVARPLIDEATLDRLMARVESEGLELLGPDGVLTELTSRIMNRAMEAEMSEHLGYDHGDPAGHGVGDLHVEDRSPLGAARGACGDGLAQSPTD